MGRRHVPWLRWWGSRARSADQVGQSACPGHQPPPTSSGGLSWASLSDPRWVWPILTCLNWVLASLLVHLSLNQCSDNFCDFMSGQSVLVTCKISSKSPAHILEHHLWNLLVNKSILAFIPHFGSFLCRSCRSKLVVSDRQQDPPHLALCSSRVKVRTEVKR